jgi:hypothetical protein
MEEGELQEVLKYVFVDDTDVLLFQHFQKCTAQPHTLV